MRDRKVSITDLGGDRKKPHRVTYWEGEKRKTKHFALPTDAQLFAKEHGWEAMDPSLAVNAEERLMVGKIRGAAQALGVSAEDIYQAGLKAMRAQQSASPAITVAVAEYRAAAEINGDRQSTLDNIDRFMRFFVAEVGPNTPVDQVAPVQASIAARQRYSNSESMRSYMAYVVAFFRWCAAPERQWAGGEWFRRIKLREQKSDKEAPMIADPQQAANFLYQTPANHQAGFAIQWLAGVRPEEIVPKDADKERLCWEDIDIEARTIRIRAAVSKIRKPRLIHDCFENLWPWLEAVPKKRRTGPIMAVSHRNFRKLRRAIADKADCPKPWPRDYCRDSFATYSFHIYGLETTINNTGHQDEQSTFFGHYKGDTIKSQAADYARLLKYDPKRHGYGIWYAMKTDGDKARDLAWKQAKAAASSEGTET